MVEGIVGDALHLVGVEGDARPSDDLDAIEEIVRLVKVKSKRAYARRSWELMHYARCCKLERRNWNVVVVVVVVVVVGVVVVVVVVGNTSNSS